MHSFQFASQNELLVAVNSATIPLEMQQQPASYGYDEDGIVTVVSHQSLTREQLQALRKTGVLCSTREKKTGLIEARHWGEIIRPVAQSGEVDCSATVLFLLPDVAKLFELAAELLRLGCDRQSFSFFSSGYALLKAISPPYYSVMKALDKFNDMTVFLPNPPGQETLWIEMGYDHPMVNRINLPGQSLGLIESSGQWRYLPDSDWANLYDVMQIELPEQVLQHSAQGSGERFVVSLRLVDSVRDAEPSLWIIDSRAIERIEQLVTHFSEKDISQLLFTVCGTREDPIVILRTRPVRGARVVMDSNLTGYSNFLSIENLFVPFDSSIEPPLRREKIKSLFAADADQLTIVRKLDEAGSIAIERVDYSAFSPLDEWVDYIVSRDHEKLVPWIKAASFEFDRFESTGVEWSDSREKLRDDKGKEKSARHAATEKKPQEKVTRPSQVRSSASSSRRSVIEESFDWTVGNDSDQVDTENATRLAEVEREFLSSELPADADERLDMWHRMARLNFSLRKYRDAALCWIRVAWGDADSQNDILNEWAGAERRAAEHLIKQKNSDSQSLVGELLKVNDADAQAIRVVASCLLSEPEQLAGQVNAIKLWFDQNDSKLDLRTFWMVRLTLSRLMGDDHLQLDHARDRVLARLCNGLSLDSDVPGFLRYCGTQTSDTDSTVVIRLQEQLLTLSRYYESTPRDASPLEAPVALTSAYVKFVFAWGFARLGDHEQAGRLMSEANKALPTDDPVHNFLRDNYNLRIQHALEGLAKETPITAELSRQLNTLDNFSRYKVDRLRQLSAILEVQERLDPMMGWQLGGEDPRGSEFANLRGLEDIDRLRDEISSLTDKAIANKTEMAEKVRLLDAVMDFFPLLGESSTVPLLRKIIDNLDSIPIEQRCVLLEEALMMAGYYGRGEIVRELVGKLEADLAQVEGDNLLQMAKTLSISMSSLRRVGLMSEAVQLLKTTFELVKGGDYSSLIARLQLVAGLAELDDKSDFQKEFTAARAALANKNLIPDDRLKIIAAMANAAGYLPLDDAIAELQKLAEQLPNITDSYNTNSHFCLSVIQFIESLVSGIAGEKLSLGELGRKWLAEDEYLIRRRVQMDRHSV